MPVPLFAPRRAQAAGGPGDVPTPTAAGGSARTTPRLVHGYAREAAALVLLATALFTALALASFQGDPLRPELNGADWVGPVGALVARAGIEAMGAAVWLVPVELVLLAAPLLHGKPSIANVTRIAGDVVVVFILAALAEVAFPKATAFGAMPLGGAVGELFGEVLRTLFSTIGSYIIGLTIVGLILIGRATFSFIDAVKRLERAFVSLSERAAAALRALLGAWATAREIDKKRDEDARKTAKSAGPRIAKLKGEDAIIAALTDDPDAEPDTGDFQIAVAPGDGPPPPLLERSLAAAAADPKAGADAEPAPKPRRGRKRAAEEDGAAAAAPPTARSRASAEPKAAASPKIVTPQVEAPKAETPKAEGPKIVAPKAEAPKAETPKVQAPKIEAAPVEAPPVEAAILKLVEGPRDAAIIAEVAPEEIDTPSPIAPVAEAKAASPRAARKGQREREEGRRQREREREREEGERGQGERGEEEQDVAESEPAALPSDDAEEEPAAPVAVPTDEQQDEAEEEESVAAEAPEPAAPPVEERPPTIVDTSPAQRTVKAAPARVVPAIGLGFRTPTTDMLEPPSSDRPTIDEEQLKEMAQLLEKTLSDYGVSGKVEEIHPGPTVTTFEVSPAAGTKVSKVAGLVDDLALGLSRKVRIIAPIPGKNRIGFEIPNEQRVPVNLRELVEDRRFQEMKAPLPCVLGRDIIGTPYFADLASMPHVIVAGATGAGKSVGLNVMLVSLLFRKTPDELRLLMIDPKVVELAPFDRIPHMLLPVVTDMKQAANALKWAVDEMERRYQLFANAGTKNITTYNNWVDRVARGEARPPKPPAKVAAVAADGSEVMVDAAKDGSDAAQPERIPFIVIVVDEFADLMMQQGKDVEASVARLAQKARAAGMHVILATQRPSVDVITGMIKANFPTRIAFRVAQKVDSRTILDEQGAEHLLGRGDMLVKMNGSNETRRVQCPFCSEEEVQKVTDFLRLQGEPVYDEAILKPRDEDGEDEGGEDIENDPMYDAAVRIVADTRRCSTSWIQRKLGVGYNRAAKLVEAMEKRGVVGPANGSKDREVLIGQI